MFFDVIIFYILFFCLGVQRTKKMKQGDWECTVCKTNNFASRRVCFGCKKTNKPNSDWNCVCGELNFAIRQICRKCSKCKSSEVKTETTDWSCDHCDFLNFARRSTCNKCGNIKKRPTISKPGDWNCQDCGKLNFANRVICFGCGQQLKKQERKDIPIDDDATCIICMEREIDTAIMVCGHLGYCNECALKMKECPICKAKYDPTTHLLKIFKC